MGNAFILSDKRRIKIDIAMNGEGTVYDLGYTPHEGPRLGRSGAFRAMVVDGTRLVEMFFWGMYSAWRQAEMPLPIGWDTGETLAAAKRLAAAGASFLALPEDSKSEARMPPYAVAQLLMPVRGIEPLIYYSCRERNLTRIQSDLLGVWATGVANVLLVTGEPTQSPLVGRGPDLDVDSIGAVPSGAGLPDRRSAGNRVGGLEPSRSDRRVRLLPQRVPEVIE